MEALTIFGNIPEKITKLACGWEHTLLLGGTDNLVAIPTVFVELGNVYGYGRHSDGQLGEVVDESTDIITRDNPIQVQNLKDIIGIACTGWSSIVLDGRCCVVYSVF